MDHVQWQIVSHYQRVITFNARNPSPPPTKRPQRIPEQARRFKANSALQSRCPKMQIPSRNQTWLAGKWTIEISVFPSYKPPLSSDFPASHAWWNQRLLVPPNPSHGSLMVPGLAGDLWRSDQSQGRTEATNGFSVAVCFFLMELPFGHQIWQLNHWRSSINEMLNWMLLGMRRSFEVTCSVRMLL